MIIYEEALPEGSAVPVREGGVQLDKESPASAKIMVVSFFIAGLLYLLRFERVDNLGA